MQLPLRAATVRRLVLHSPSVFAALLSELAERTLPPPCPKGRPRLVAGVARGSRLSFWVLRVSAVERPSGRSVCRPTFGSPAGVSLRSRREVPPRLDRARSLARPRIPSRFAPAFNTDHHHRDSRPIRIGLSISAKPALSIFRYRLL